MGFLKNFVRLSTIYSLLLPILIPPAMARRIKPTRSPELIESDFEEYDFPACKQFESESADLQTVTCPQGTAPAIDETFLAPMKTMELKAEKAKYLQGLKEFLKARLEPEIMKREFHKQCFEMDMSSTEVDANLKAFCKTSLYGDPDNPESNGYVGYIRSTYPELRTSMALMKVSSVFHPLKFLDVPTSISEVTPPAVSEDDIEIEASQSTTAPTRHQLFPVKPEHGDIGAPIVEQDALSEAEKDLVTHRYLQEDAKYEQQLLEIMAVPATEQNAVRNITNEERALIETNGNEYSVKGAVQRSGNFEPVEGFWSDACMDFTFSLEEEIEKRSGQQLANLNPTQKQTLTNRILQEKAEQNHPCVAGPGEKTMNAEAYNTTPHSMVRMNSLQNRLNYDMRNEYEKKYSDLIQQDKTLRFMNLGDVRQYPETEEGNKKLLLKASEGNDKYIDFLQSQHQAIDNMTEDQLAGFFKYKGLIDEYLKTADPLEKAHCDLSQTINDKEEWSDLWSGLGLAAFAVGGAVGCVFSLSGIGAVACAGGVGAVATAIDVNKQYEEFAKMKTLHAAGAVTDAELSQAESALALAIAMVPVGTVAGAGIGKAFQAIPVSRLSGPAKRAYERIRGTFDSSSSNARVPAAAGEWEDIGRLRLGSTVDIDGVPTRLISALGRMKNEAHLSDADAEGIVRAYLAAGREERDEILSIINKRREAISSNPNFVCR